MSDAPKADPVVKETEIRTALDRVTQGAVDLQRQLGAVVPNVELAKRFARNVVEQTVKRHEDRMAHPLREPGALSTPDPVPDQPPDRLSRGDVGEGGVAVTRRTGTATYDPLTGRFTAAIEKPKPKGAPPDPLLLERLRLLDADNETGDGKRYPEWSKKLWDAVNEGERFAIALGCTTIAERLPIVADFVINVAEQSNVTFGDWRFPKAPATKLIVSG